MLANCESYTRRLLRMKTLSADFQFAQAAGGAADRESGSSASGTERRIPRRPPAASKYSGSQLWLRKPQHCKRETQQPQLVECNSSTTGTDRETRACLDLQTNNSRRGWDTAGEGFGHRGGVAKSVNNANTARSLELGDDEDDEDFDVYEDEESSLEDLFASGLQNSNTGSAIFEAGNENAVAKATGANALVKQSTSRQTEIIDTSKLKEAGKVETQYEEPEDEPEEIDETDYKQTEEYEKTFAYARRLRALLNMKFQVTERGNIETNFLLIKAHEHPKQKGIDRWRNVDLGQPYDSQVRMRKLINDYKLTCNPKVAKKGEVPVPVFPDWIKFQIRFKKDNADKRWKEFTAHRLKMKKLSGGRVNVPKANDRYLPVYYDVWSTSLVAYAKPEATLLDVMNPVFAKLGLAARADFRFTIGCFEGDKRVGKAKVQGAPSVPKQVTLQVVCADLYKRNSVEIFVNDNRIEMFQEFPTFYSGPSSVDPLGDADKYAEGKKNKKKQEAKNQSNLESDEQQLFVALAKRSSDQLAEEVVEFDLSSMSDANHNLSMHECASSDKFESEPTVEGQLRENQVWSNES